MAKNYHYILTVNTTTGFSVGNVILGTNTSATAFIANVDSSLNNIKVSVDNAFQEFEIGELVYSVEQVTSGGSANTNISPYTAPYPNTQSNTATAIVSAINVTKFIREKTSLEQNPIVRLYTLYYPGEWYPPNANGNPVGNGEGYAWPANFPFRFAEIRADLVSDITYAAVYNGANYTPYPMESSGIEVDSTGKINEISLIVANYDNLITVLVENPNLAGNNNANAQSAYVNGELVTNIDPRTIPGNALYDQSIVDARGATNLAFDYSSTEDVNGYWTNLKLDSRDLLGAVVEIKTTYANFMDVWIEYSTVTDSLGNAIQLYTSEPYRRGDNVRSNSSTNEFTITNIEGNLLFLNTDDHNFLPGEKVYIVNPDADPDAYVVDAYKINELEGLDEKVAKFNLTSWLQYFKLVLPKRRFLKNTCTWVYKGPECQYPEDGTGNIAGSSETANGFLNINNEEVFTVAEDVCAHNYQACLLRHNQHRFGGFIGTGRTVPR